MLINRFLPEFAETMLDHVARNFLKKSMHPMLNVGNPLYISACFMVGDGKLGHYPEVIDNINSFFRGL
ncbi:MAG: hypothetical protein ACPGGD_04050 [Thalassolituus sp.]